MRANDTADNPLSWGWPPISAADKRRSDQQLNHKGHEEKQNKFEPPRRQDAKNYGMKA
jgi:hypothetical protein